MMKKVVIYIAILLFFLTGMRVSAAPRLQPTDDVVTIVIDPGHGGRNEGTKENGVLEKAMTLTTALAMYEELCKYDNVNVYLTRTSDVDSDLEERAEYAQSVGADFLFSIHYNASLSHEMYGSEVWTSLVPPYNAYGYQFGEIQMQTMQDMGLFLRGVKTRQGDDGDYYGIIRHSVTRGIPAVIIEHCHVDEDRDAVYCDSEEDLIAFGRADALSVAKYFGLRSTELGVDYSGYSSSELAEASASALVQRTAIDTTEPDVCQLTLLDTDYDAGTVTLEISAADYDSLLLYYSYSLDGGQTYSQRFSWPDSNALDGSYRDTFTTTLQVPLAEQPEIIFSAYNLYDLYTESNSVKVMSTLPAETQTQDPESIAVDGPAVVQTQTAPDTDSESSASVSSETSSSEESKLPGTTTFRPDLPEEVEQEKPVKFASFLAICVGIMVTLLVIVLVSQSISDRNRRKRRRQRRKADGESSHQLR